MNDLEGFDIVWARPVLSPRTIGGVLARRGELPAFLRSANVHFFHLGRNALWHGARALKLPANSCVAVPTFHCGTELDALLHLGLRLKFYEVTRSLQVDLASLEATLDDHTRAVLVTHYFGLPQNMSMLRDFCNHHRLRLIEDCAHTLEATQDGKLLGTFGDVAFFSLHKLLPAPDGGALIVNSDDLEPPAPARRVPSSITWDYLKRDLVRSRLATLRPRHQSDIGDRRFLRWVYPGLSKFGDGDGYLRQRKAEWHGLDPKQLVWDMAPLSYRVLRNSDCQALRHHRMANYRFLANRLIESDEVEPLVRDVPAECCPLAFPVSVKDPGGLMRHLLAHGIETGPFWNSNHPSFSAQRWPRGALLQDHVMPLPVHQQLDEEALEHVACVVNAWAERRNTHV